MAGRKHHHVPQLLQKGFSTKIGKAFRTTVFEKSGNHFTTSTANYGAQRDFYAIGDDFTTDDEITKFEDKNTAFLQSLQKGIIQPDDHTQQIASIIAHLEVRTLFLREELKFIASELFDFLEESFCNPKTLSKILKTYLENNPKILETELHQHTGQTDSAKGLIEFVKPLMGQLIDEQSKPMALELSAAIKPMLPQLINKIKVSHLKVLRNNASPVQRAKNYHNLRFRLIEFNDEQIILPDTMVIFTHGNKVSPILDNSEKLETVYFPLSSHRVLIGTDYRANSTESARQLNRMLASCSFERFIAKKNEPTIVALTHRIGNNASLLNRMELKSILRSALQEALD